jgi:pimeloyl-ACP methyl ester carboxylesterase
MRRQVPGSQVPGSQVPGSQVPGGQVSGWGIATVIFVLSIMATHVTLAQTFDDVTFGYQRCPFALPAGEQYGKTLDCGILIVPERRDNQGNAHPDTTLIEVAVAILYAREQPAQPDAVIYLEGGPGGSALAALEAWTDSSLRATRDLILVDQRGTGYSLPVLNCEEMEDDRYDTENEAMAACRDRLEQDGIHLASYNSRENAADIAALIRAFDLNEVNLYGISYGTRLALTIMRDQPNRIRSVVLDSTYPPDVASLAEGPTHMQRAFDGLFSACRESRSCNAAYPELEAKFYSLLEDLNTTPFDLADGYELAGIDYAESLFQALYNSELIPVLPFAISLALEGDIQTSHDLVSWVLSLEDIVVLDSADTSFEATSGQGGLLQNLSELLRGAAEDIDDDAEGMFYAVECYEEAPFHNAQMIITASRSVHPSFRQDQIDFALAFLQRCIRWHNDFASEFENMPVVSDIPTLILAGALDPITPPAWGKRASTTLASSTFVELPGMGHGLIDVNPCVDQLVSQFLDAPEAELDSRCATAMRPSFYVPD